MYELVKCILKHQNKRLKLCTKIYIIFVNFNISREKKIQFSQPEESVFKAAAAHLEALFCQYKWRLSRGWEVRPPNLTAACTTVLLFSSCSRPWGLWRLPVPTLVTTPGLITVAAPATTTPDTVTVAAPATTIPDTVTVAATVTTTPDRVTAVVRQTIILDLACGLGKTILALAMTSPDLVTTTPDQEITTLDPAITSPDLVTTTLDQVTSTPDLVTTTLDRATTTPDPATSTLGLEIISPDLATYSQGSNLPSLSAVLDLISDLNIENDADLISDPDPHHFLFTYLQPNIRKC